MACSEKAPGEHCSGVAVCRCFLAQQRFAEESFRGRVAFVGSNRPLFRQCALARVKATFNGLNLKQSHWVACSI